MPAEETVDSLRLQTQRFSSGAPISSAPREARTRPAGVSAHALALCPPVVTTAPKLAVLLARSARILQTHPRPTLLCQDLGHHPAGWPCPHQAQEWVQELRAGRQGDGTGSESQRLTIQQGEGKGTSEPSQGRLPSVEPGSGTASQAVCAVSLRTRPL